MSLESCTRVFNFFDYSAYSEVLSPEVSFAQAMEILEKAAPRDMLIHGDSIERALRRKKKEKFVHKVFLEDFNRGPLIRKAGKSICLTGPSATGKTTFALAHFQNPMLVSDIDQLKEYRPGWHDGIVFDDMSFHHIPPEKVIYLVDQDYERTIRCRHTNAVIPAHTAKIFTHNVENPFYKLDGPMAATPLQAAAIDRRVEYYRVPLPLFGSFVPPGRQIIDLVENV